MKRILTSLLLMGACWQSSVVAGEHVEITRHIEKQVVVKGRVLAIDGAVSTLTIGPGAGDSVQIEADLEFWSSNKEWMEEVGEEFDIGGDTLGHVDQCDNSHRVGPLALRGNLVDGADGHAVELDGASLAQTGSIVGVDGDDVARIEDAIEFAEQHQKHDEPGQRHQRGQSNEEVTGAFGHAFAPGSPPPTGVGGPAVLWACKNCCTAWLGESRNSWGAPCITTAPS